MFGWYKKILIFIDRGSPYHRACVTGQCWYFDASETRGIAIETSETQFVGSLPLDVGRSSGEVVEASGDMVDVYTLQGYPLKGLVRK